MSAVRNPGYISIRDDSGVKSLSSVEREFVQNGALHGIRTDGRRWDQVRPQRLFLVRGENTATATVQWGSRVTCTCSASLIPPHPDRPNEGIVSLSVDLSPAALTSFRHTKPASTAGQGDGMMYNRGGPVDESQKLLTNRVLRCLERILLTGGALDTEALCAIPDHWVWKLDLSVTVLDAAGGNILDASVLSCMASLRHYRKPHVEQQTTTDGDEAVMAPVLIATDVKEPTPLPLHHTPLAVSFCLVTAEDSMKGSAAATASSPDIVSLLDPSHREELVAAGSLVTLAMNVHGEMCFLDYGGGCELQPSLLRELHGIASKLLQKDLCPALESSLKQADEQALQERLKRLQGGQEVPTVPTGTEEQVNMAYHQSAGEGDDILQVDADRDGANVAARRAQTAAEEEYRQQALDYNLGHRPNKVRDDGDTETKGEGPRGPDSSSLLAAMLQSVSQSTQPEQVTDSEANNTPSNVLPMELEDKSTTVTDKLDKSREPTPAPGVETSDDEDEAPMQLESEFQSIDTPKAIPDNEEDVDDLAGAIKKKKKKKKAKK